ncbi:MAG: FecR domain-containing protein [Bacteroidota bacterium]
MLIIIIKPTMKNDELLHKWINRTISQEELEEFKRRPEYEQLELVYQNTADLEAPDFDGASMLKEILADPQREAQADANDNSRPLRKKSRSNWMALAIAASVLFLIGYFFWPSSQLVRYQLAKNGRIEGSLPDLSTFVLNAETTLSYDKNSWDSNRSLRLDGEAFFQVKKGSTFIVKTPLGKVQVLGTEFNVKNRAGVFEVTCREGKVAVISKGKKQEETLIAGQSVRINRDGTVERKEGLSRQADSWVNGITKLTNVTTRELIAELERQFDIEIETGDLDLNQRISCNFQHEDLKLALKTATSSLGVQFKIIDKKKVILSK